MYVIKEGEDISRLVAPSKVETDDESIPDGNMDAWHATALEEAERIGRMMRDFGASPPSDCDITIEDLWARFHRLRALYGETILSAFLRGQRTPSSG